MTDKHTIFGCQFCAGIGQDCRQVGNSGRYLLDRDLKAQLRNDRSSKRN